MLGCISLMLGEHEAAITQFERLRPPPNRSAAWLRADAFEAPLRGHPCVKALLVRSSR